MSPGEERQCPTIGTRGITNMAVVLSGTRNLSQIEQASRVLSLHDQIAQPPHASISSFVRERTPAPSYGWGRSEPASARDRLSGPALPSSRSAARTCLHPQPGEVCAEPTEAGDGRLCPEGSATSAPRAWAWAARLLCVPAARRVHRCACVCTPTNSCACEHTCLPTKPRGASQLPVIHSFRKPGHSLRDPVPIWS